MTESNSPMQSMSQWIKDLLKQAPDTSASAATPVTTDKADPDSEEDIDDCIQLYFNTEDAVERDVILARIVASNLPRSAEFLQSVCENDDDPSLRIDASMALARRGDVKAIEQLEAYVVSLDDSNDFALVAECLIELKKEEATSLLSQIWLDVSRELDIRREALTLIECDAPSHALVLLRQAVQKIQAPNDLDAELIDTVIMTYARLDPHAGIDVLVELGEVLLGWQTQLDRETYVEMEEWVDNGLAFLMQASNTFPPPV